MSDEREDHTYDYWVDEVLDLHGPEWAAERADEIIKEYQNSGLSDSILAAHQDAARDADALFERANERLDQGVFDEAAFAAFRALEGYCTSVFIVTLHEVLTAPFEKLMAYVTLKSYQLLG